MIRPGTVLYASSDCTEAVEEARAYIRENGLTAELVRLIRKEGQVLVVSREDFKWPTANPADTEH